MPGDLIEAIRPAGNEVVTLEQMVSEEGVPLTVAAGSGHRVRIPMNARVDKALLARLL